MLSEIEEDKSAKTILLKKVLIGCESCLMLGTSIDELLKEMRQAVDQILK